MVAAPEGFVLKKKAPPPPEGYVKKGGPTVERAAPVVGPQVERAAPVGDTGSGPRVENAPPPPPPPEPTTADYIWDTAKSAPSALATLASETLMSPVSIGRMGSLDAPSEDLPWYRKTLPQLLGYEDYAKPAREALVKGEDVVRSTIQENLHQPQYAPAKFGHEAVQWIGPAAWPSKSVRLAEGLPRLFNYAGDILAHGAMPWAAYEGAEKLAPGTGVPAALAAALAGGAATTARSPQAVVRRETAGLTEAQFAESQRLQDFAKTKGIDLSASEAIAQVTNQPNHPLLKSLRLSEAHPSGAAVTGPFFEPRAGQVDVALNSALGDIAPSPAAPQNIGPDVSRAATQVQRGAEAGRTAAEQPFYRAADPTTVDEPALNAFISKLDADIARYNPQSAIGNVLQQFREKLISRPAQPETAGTPRQPGAIDPATGKPRYYTNATSGTPAVPEQFALDRLNLDTVKKEFRDATRQGQVGQVSLPSNVKGVMGDYLDQLDTILETGSPEYQAGKQTHADVTRNVVQPIESGPIGDFAKAGSTEDIVRTLFPGAPTSATTRALADAIDRVRATGQDMLPAVRDAMDRIFSRVSGGTLAGDRSRVGAKFAQVLSGSPQKQELLDLVLASTGAPVPATKNFGDLLEVLRATGKRLTEGSPTAQLNAQMGDLSAIPALDAASALATQSLGPLLTGGLKDYVLRGNIQDLAALTTGPVRNVQAAGAQAWKHLVPDVAKSTGLAALFAKERENQK